MFASMTCGMLVLFVLVSLVAVLAASDASSETCIAGGCQAAAGISATETAVLSDADFVSVEDVDADAVRFSLIQKDSPQLLQSLPSAEVFQMSGIPDVAFAISNVTVQKVARHGVEEEEESWTSKEKVLANRSSPEVEQNDVKIQKRSNQGAELRQSQYLSEFVLDEIEFELHRTDLSGKSKLVLALLEGLALPAFFGIDRCYMGQCCIGTVKGITLGGLGIWAIIDYIVVLINMLEKKDSISSFGFNASFLESTITSAFWVSVLFLVFKFLSMCCSSGQQFRKS